MSNKTTNKFSSEVRECAVRMALDREGHHPSRWAELVSIVKKIGCTSRPSTSGSTRRRSTGGRRACLPRDLIEKMKALERENRELSRAKELLRKASAYFAQAKLHSPLKK